MAYWHYDNGNPAPWGEGRFDWSHAMPAVLIVAAVVLSILLNK